jgi:hypothetical protein
MRPLLILCPSRNNAKEFLVHDDEVIPRGKPVCGIENVRSPPADKLLAGFNVQSTAMVAGAQAANGKQGTLEFTVLPRKM